MKNIAYIEIDTHAEIAADFLDLMKDSKEFSVDYYFSEKIKNQIPQNSENIFLSDQSVILSQLKSKKYDLIIIGTVHRYFNTFLSITQKFKTAVIVHNLNFPKASKFNLIKNIFREDLFYRLKLLWREGLTNSSKVYQNASQLVLDKSFSSSEYQFLPLFYTKEFIQDENEKLMVVIPGGVSQKRRDYRHVLNTIEKSKSAADVEFVFLGKAKGDELMNIRKVSEKFDLRYFTERISQKEFEMWMKKADVLWCPIQQETEFFSQKEIYGKTKMTGNIGDAIKFGKIAVFPKNYSSKMDFIVQEKEDVIQQFYDLKNFKYDFQKAFNKKAVLKNLENLLADLT
ncbi:hypothetical protein [Chryseobacterium caseinilyticum]|uniref:Glycosyl transferase family 1 domain-containing protein n=1 Tax=Chryseobacterium caseinilyticum TaxID=2771428 RepID=A0ABR8ZBR1_9FLAO|nr:hypothetical protein [Chryseobacterium caseinilyticum]MBD8082288.1 hypothetical protein [Chryseobacterium caseinilyticum]